MTHFFSIISGPNNYALNIVPYALYSVSNDFTSVLVVCSSNQCFITSIYFLVFRYSHNYAAQPDNCSLFKGKNAGACVNNNCTILGLSRLLLS